MHTTDYFDTFIEVAEDSPTDHAVEPPHRDQPTVAELHYELISARPYELTSDDVLFETYARRNGIADADRPAAREQLFSKGQACLRSSPLGKRYGWGIHSDDQGRVALYARESEEYRRLAGADDVAHTRAMRSSRG
ncbi:DUF6157 family protein [Microbacterium aoyamense]|uniref:DUF6157 family protein n=1 Tax=Microbacterium aoyamense TaxID=344166 RepID=A0ABP5BCI5_9MICO|nr:DUF6157 family protein [Microbacterium aoyamense]